MMHLRAKSTDKQKDWIEDQQNVNAIGMQVQQVPDREPLPRGTQHCDHCSRKTDRVKDLLASAALVYGIVPADKDVDAAQVERQIGHVPLACVKQDGLFHKLISQHQDKNSAKDLLPGHFPAAAIDHGAEKDDCNRSEQFCPMDGTKQRECAVIYPALCLYRLHRLSEIFHTLLLFCDSILQ